MSSNATTLLAGAIGLGCAALSDRETLMCFVGYYGTVNSISAQTAANGAAASGYHGLSDRELDQCLLNVLSH